MALILDDILMELFTASSYFINLVKDTLTKIYDIVSDAIARIMDFVRFIFTSFPFDDAKKTFMLSIIFLVMVLAVILFFSGSDWRQGGIDKMDRVVSLGVDFNTFGDASIPAGNQSGGGIIPPLNNVSGCLTDDDCQTIGGEPMGNLKCCFPQQYEGFACAGYCLKDEGIGRDACKLPNACYHEGSFSDFVGYDLNRCDVYRDTGQFGGWADSTVWCQKHGSSDGSTIDSRVSCCNGFLTPCYGYCLRSGGSYNCNDITACYNQKTPSVVLVEGNDTL